MTEEELPADPAEAMVVIRARVAEAAAAWRRNALNARDDAREMPPGEWRDQTAEWASRCWRIAEETAGLADEFEEAFRRLHLLQ